MLCKAKYGDCLGRFEDDWKEGLRSSETSQKACVAKTHRFDEVWLFGADKIVTSRRDLRDVAASALRRGLIGKGAIDTINYLFRTYMEYEQWEPWAGYTMVYEEMIQDRKAEGEKLAKYLEVDTDVGLIVTLVDELPLSNEGNPDREILLHPNHFTDGRAGSWKGYLPNKIVDAVNIVFEAPLKKWGYVQ
jgi:hypothetical protein